MTVFVKLNQYGFIEAKVENNAESVDGYQVYTGPALSFLDILNRRYYFASSTGSWVDTGNPPGPSFSFSMVSKQWVDTNSIQDYRDAQWELIKAARESNCTDPITVDGNVFDADTESQQRIAGAVQLAILIGSSFTIEWTLADNSSAILNQTEMIELGVAVGVRVSACWTQGRALRAAIDSAASIEDIQEIQWTTI